MEDIEIIDLYNARQESAISETKKKYNTYLMCIANNILHNSQDNEECVSDTYLKTWNAIPPSVPRSLKAFIGKITRNGALNMLRDADRHKRKAMTDNVNLSELDEMLVSSNSIEQSMECQEIQKILNDFLDNLSLEKRVIFIRRYWYFDSIKDIMARMDMSENNVKSVLKRERDALREVLIKEGIL